MGFSPHSPRSVRFAALACLALPAPTAWPQPPAFEHRCARIEDLCQQMEALAGAPENKDTTGKLEEQFEKTTGFRAPEPAWPERVKACRA